MDENGRDRQMRRPSNNNNGRFEEPQPQQQQQQQQQSPQQQGNNNRDRSLDRGRERGSMKASMSRVYVSNIPYEVRWQDMKDLFRSEVGDVTFVEMFVDENDQPKGSAIVEFMDPESVPKCCEIMNRWDIKGRKLVIKEDTGNQRDKHGTIVGRRAPPPMPMGGMMREDRFRDRGYDGPMMNDGANGNFSANSSFYGLSPQFLDSLGIDPPLVTRVFVANLEYNVDKKKLKEVFRMAGKVQKVEMPFDKDGGRSRGFAVIEYEHPVEAVQAISMFHNQFLYDRNMTVRLDRAHNESRLPEGLKGVGMGLGQNGEPLKNVAQNIESISSTKQKSSAGIAAPVATALQVALSSLAKNPLEQAVTSLLGTDSSSSLANLVSTSLQQPDAHQPFLNRNADAFPNSQPRSNFNQGLGGFNQQRNSADKLGFGRKVMNVSMGQGPASGNRF